MTNLKSTEVGFIKNLLKNTFLPTVPCVSYGDYITKGRHYLYKNMIIRCTSSGILRDLQSGYLCSLDNICSSSFICGVGMKIATYDPIEDYSYRGFVPGLTSKFINRSEGYDLDTHLRLGEYLEWKSSYLGVDARSLYNYFYPTESQRLSFGKFNHNVDSQYVEEFQLMNKAPVSTRKVYTVPIKFNKDYNIYIEPSAHMICTPCFLTKQGYTLSSDLRGRIYQKIHMPNGETQKSYTFQGDYYLYSVQPSSILFGYGNNIENKSSLTSPVKISCKLPDEAEVVYRYPLNAGAPPGVETLYASTYDTFMSCEDVIPYEQYLHLVIEVDADYTGPILVSSGKPYLFANILKTNANISNFIGSDAPWIDDGTITKQARLPKYESCLGCERIEDTCEQPENWYEFEMRISKPNSLVEELIHFNPRVITSLMSTNKYSPFSNTLFYYLVEHSIGPDTTIPLNVKRIQESLHYKFGESARPDIWQDDMMAKIYALYFSKSPDNKQDIIGSVGRDIESVL